jgi:hypothetical protein
LRGGKPDTGEASRARFSAGRSWQINSWHSSGVKRSPRKLSIWDV